MIGGFERIKRRLMMSLREEYFLSVQGSTDSEGAFAVYLNELANLGCVPSEQKLGGFGHAVLRTALMNTIFTINKLCKEEKQEEEPNIFNFAVTDGEAVVACRYISSRTEEAASLFFRLVFLWILVYEQFRVFFLSIRTWTFSNGETG